MNEQDGVIVDHIPGEAITTVLELLAAIRRRPPMYLGKRYISCLKAYLDGWCGLAYQHGIDVQAQCLGAFQEWIIAKYGITSSHGWASIILFYSTDESEALTNFFALFDEWQQQAEAKA